MSETIPYGQRETKINSNERVPTVQCDPQTDLENRVILVTVNDHLPQENLTKYICITLCTILSVFTVGMIIWALVS